MKLLDLWFKDDLRPAALFAINAIGWSLVIDNAYYQGTVILASVLVAMNIAAAIFHVLLYVKTRHDRRDIDH